MPKTKYLVVFALSFLFFVPFATAQTYQWSKAVNALNHGQITAQTVSQQGDVYIASYVQAIPSSSNFGLNTAFHHGELVLSKLDSSGTQVWSQTIPNSNARIFAMVLHEDSLIISGGYFDSLAFSSTDEYIGDSYYSGSFLAKFDTSGNYSWSLAIPPANFISYVSVGLELQDTVLYEIGVFYGSSASIRSLNLSGDTLANLQMPSAVRYVSDIELDSDGSIYISGGAFPTGFIDTIQVPKPPNSTGYLNYVAKLNSNLRALWVRSSNYKTLDLTPEIELFSGQIAFLTNEFPLGGSTPGSHIIKYFNSDGDLLHIDSVTNEFFIHHDGRMSLSSNDSVLFLARAIGDSVLHLTRINNVYQDSLLAIIKCKTLANYPKLNASNNALYFTSSFYTPNAIVNAQDTVYNLPNSSKFTNTYREMLVKFKTSKCEASFSQFDVAACRIYYSPSGKTWKASGIHYDTLVNSTGCDSILTINLSLTEVDTGVTQDGKTLTSNATESEYQWLNCDSAYSEMVGDTNQLFTALSDGNYAVEVTKNGCKDTSECISIVTTSVSNHIYINKLIIYPNPGSDFFTLDLSGLRDVTIQIVNSQGQICFKEMNINEELYSFDITDEAGMYIVEISNESISKRLRFVKL